MFFSSHSGHFLAVLLAWMMFVKGLWGHLVVIWNITSN